nr:MAG TPA: hypothetical protein [Bacteriophage sp.]DAO24097.1 MAG TPA: hypothetical protein [Caudoviricetes sp.]
MYLDNSNFVYGTYLRLSTLSEILFSLATALFLSTST